jgi:hypothetical protein
VIIYDSSLIRVLPVLKPISVISKAIGRADGSPVSVALILIPGLM